VVGGGPAGCAAAIALARAGLRVGLLDRSAPGAARAGETLPPEIGVLLGRLGAWDRFLGDGHLRSPGMLAAWGQPDPYANDFIVNPHGPGWRVDRDRFDTMLAGVAADAGAAVLHDTEVAGCRPEADGGWILSAARCDGEASPRLLSAAVVVDATGRASPLRRQLGGRRVTHDRLVALTAVVAPGARPAPEDLRSLVEAAEDGWWYTATLPGAGMVVALHTDAAPGLRDRWWRQLGAATHTSARIAGRTPCDLRHVAAGSQRREPAASGTWLAVGDAAASHDPISGLGVYRALESGMAAADAIVARAGGEADALEGYAQAARARFDEYLSQRAQYYRAEDRWPDAPFWRRRRPAPISP
jgi:flavin-dependent dehydrogenase